MPFEVPARCSWDGVAALLRAVLLRFILGRFLGLGKEIDLLGDDLAAVAGLALGVGPAGVVDAAGDHDHSALGDVLGDALAGAVEAGDPVPFGLGLAVAFAVLEAAAGGERDAGDRGAALGGADFGIVANKADEGDGVLYGLTFRSSWFRPRNLPFDWAPMRPGTVRPAPNAVRETPFEGVVRAGTRRGTTRP